MKVRVVLAALAAGMMALTAPLVAAQSGATGRSSAQGGCSGNCEEEVAALTRDLARARAELARLAELLANRGDSLNARELASAREQLVRALRSMEMLEAEYRAQSVPRVIVRRRQAPVAIESGTISREGWLGVSFSSSFEVESQSGQQRIFRFHAYPVVEAVEPASPARRAGIEVGDILIAFKGKDLRKEPIALDALLTPGSQLPVMLRRGSRTHTVTVLVGERPRHLYEWSPAVAPTPAPDRVAIASPPGVAPTPTPPPGVWGVYVSSDAPVLAGANMAVVPEELHEQLSVKGGLLVLTVLPNLPAARAGLRQGDVIVGVEGNPIRSSGQLQTAIRRAKDRVLTLEVVRAGKPMSVKMEW